MMTNEEAIMTLKANYPDACFEQLREAVDMAITALTAQPDLEEAYICGETEAEARYHAQQRWIPCSERLPEEDHWLGGSGRQFSDEVLVSVANYDDEDIWTYISQTIDGEWALELPKHCKIIAWMPLPEPYSWAGTFE